MDKIYLVLPEKLGKVAPEIYGVFAEHIGGVIYDGIYCGEDSGAENIRGFRKMIIDKMKEAGISMIRWPGGCFAEVYDWRDGIGPKEDRPTRVSWWTRFDGKYESNQVGTDEFLDFCQLCEAEPYVAANITSTTPLNIRDWVDYCNSPAGTTTMAKLREKNGHKEPYNVKYWGVGNENWGGGGNMTPEYYAMEFRRYAEMMYNVTDGLQLIACGSNGTDYEWHRKLLDNITSPGSPRFTMAGVAPHYYTGGMDTEPVNFDVAMWDKVIGFAGKIEDAIKRFWAQAVANRQEANAKLCIDEWGCWHKDGTGPSKGGNLFEQQSSQMDAVVAALTLNIFNNNCEKIKLATVAQLVNNLHALFLSAGEKCICTPSYHVFKMYRSHQNGAAVRSIPTGENCSVSASVKDGILTVTVANLSATEELNVQLDTLGGVMGKCAQLTVLGDGDIHAHNTFEDPERLVSVSSEIADFDGKLNLAPGAIAAVTVPYSEN